jgi:hypothetical protein
MRIRIIPHPLSPNIFTVTRNGFLIPAVNGTSILALHALFRRLVVLPRRQK